MACGARLVPEFLCETLNEWLGDQENLAGGTGIAQQHFNIGEARLLEIIVPPKLLQQEFAERVAEIRGLETIQGASGSRLDAMFQSMLHSVFAGAL